MEKANCNEFPSGRLRLQDDTELCLRAPLRLLCTPHGTIYGDRFDWNCFLGRLNVQRLVEMILINVRLACIAEKQRIGFVLQTHFFGMLFEDGKLPQHTNKTRPNTLSCMRLCGKNGNSILLHPLQSISKWQMIYCWFGFFCFSPFLVFFFITALTTCCWFTISTRARSMGVVEGHPLDKCLFFFLYLLLKRRERIFEIHMTIKFLHQSFVGLNFPHFFRLLLSLDSHRFRFRFL